jgi:hypothetical protein
MTLNAGAAIWDVFELLFNTLYWLFFAPFGVNSSEGVLYFARGLSGVQSLLIVFFVRAFLSHVLALLVLPTQLKPTRGGQFVALFKRF